MNNEEDLLGKYIRQVSDDMFDEDKVDFSDQAQKNVLQRLRNSKKNYFKILLVASVIIVIAGVSGLLSNSWQPKNMNIPAGGVGNAPFIKFSEELMEVKSDSYPVNSGQIVTIKSKGSLWKGSILKLYYVEDNDQNQARVFTDKVLPQGAQLIGQIPINHGDWQMDWKVPDIGANLLIIAQSDQNEFAGIRVSMRKK